jgi:hypothetical protein
VKRASTGRGQAGLRSRPYESARKLSIFNHSESFRLEGMSSQVEILGITLTQGAIISVFRLDAGQARIVLTSNYPRIRLIFLSLQRWRGLDIIRICILEAYKILSKNL